MRIAPFSPIPAVSWRIRTRRPDAVAAVALARDEHGRPPAAVARQPAADELRQRLEVALVAEVLLRVRLVARARRVFLLVVLLLLAVLLDDPAEARSDGVDEDEIREREPGLVVLDEPRRHRRQRAVRRKVDALWPDGADVQVRGRCSRPAVEHERHRPVEVAALGDVRDGEDLRRRLLLLPEDEPFRGRRVRDVVPRPRGRGAARRLVVELRLGASRPRSCSGRYTTARARPMPGNAPRDPASH